MSRKLLPDYQNGKAAIRGTMAKQWKIASNIQKEELY